MAARRLVAALAYIIGTLRRLKYSVLQYDCETEIVYGRAVYSIARIRHHCGGAGNRIPWWSA